MFRAQREQEQKRAQEKEQKAKVPVVPVEKPIDPAVLAEMEAKKEREKIPLEERVRKFREMLEEKGVTGGSAWEKTLSTIVFDDRYLILSATERKAVSCWSVVP